MDTSPKLGFLRSLMPAVAGGRTGHCLKIASLFAIATLGTASERPLAAATLTFDANTALAGAQDGSGTWSVTTPVNWYDGTTDVAWPNTTDTAVFGVGGTSGTVTVSGTVNAAAIMFNQSGYTLSGSGTVNANPASGSSFVFSTAGGTSTVSTGFSLAAGSQFRKTGPGTLSLSTTSGGTAASPLSTLITGGTYSGATGYFDSILSVGLLNIFGAQPTNLTTEVILDAGTIKLTGTNSYAGAATRRIQVNAAGGAIIDGGGSGTQAGSVLGVGNYFLSPVVDNAAATSSLYLSNVSGSTAFQGVISGGGSVTWNGAGTLALGAVNTYTGGTVVKKGTLQLAGGSLGTNTLSLAAGTTLSLQNAVLPFTLGGSGADQLFIQTGNVVVGGLNNIRLTAGSGFTQGTYTLLSAPAGGLTGSYEFDGGFNLTVPSDPSLSIPALVQIKNVNGTFYKVNLQNSSVAEQVVVTPAPAHAIKVMPLGSSSTQGVTADSAYNGGGYRSGLYQRFVNDGRFTPIFVGSSTVLSAGGASTGYNVLTGANVINHEGHSGYTAYDILENLNGNGNDGGNNGGYWLTTDPSKTGSQVQPDYITLNIGNNDYAYNAGETLGPVNRVDAIITLVQTLRPNAHVVVGNLLYRADNTTVGPLQNTWFNPRLPAVVFNHTLAGYDVSMIDSYSVLTPNDSLANIGTDKIHPTQTGYNIYSNIWFNGIIYGSSYWTGAQNNQWSTVTAGNGTNFAQDRARTLDRGRALDATTDVYFNGNSAPLPTTLGQDLAVRSVNFTAGATGPVTVGGNNTLTLGIGGITVQSGTGTHLISSNVVLGSNQTWGNVSSNALTVGGTISGAATLAITGSYTLQVQTAAGANTTTTQTGSGTGPIVLSGANTYSGGTTVGSGTLVISNTSGSGTGTGGVTIASGATLTDNGNVDGNVSVSGTVNGSGSFGGAVGVSNGGVFGASGTIAGALNINSGGLVMVAGGTLQVNGGVVNNGTLRLERGAALVVGNGKTFVNNGTLDIITGSFSAPAGFTNNGAVIDAGVVAVKSAGLTGGAFTVSIDGYTGHTYQLQRSTSLTNAPFIGLGSVLTGTTGTVLTFTDAAPSPDQGFYRVQVDP